MVENLFSITLFMVFCCQLFIPDFNEDMVASSTRPSSTRLAAYPGMFRYAGLSCSHKPGSVQHLFMVGLMLPEDPLWPAPAWEEAD